MSKTESAQNKVQEAMNEFSCYLSKKLPDETKASLALGLHGLHQANKVAIDQMETFGKEVQKQGGAPAALQHRAAGRYFIHQGAIQHHKAAIASGSGMPMVATSAHTIFDALWSLNQVRQGK